MILYFDELSCLKMCSFFTFTAKYMQSDRWEIDIRTAKKWIVKKGVMHFGIVLICIFIVLGYILMRKYGLFWEIWLRKTR